MITAILPCRSGSERVKRKNTRNFAGIEGGLLAIKLGQLKRCALVDKIMVSTDDPEVKEIARQHFAQDPKRLIIDDRPGELASSTTTTDELIAYIAPKVETGTVLWTHVTSPFLDAGLYLEMLETYLDDQKYETFDSLMSVTLLRTFIWDDQGPVNYDRAKEKWPRTQTLPTYYEINSGAFIYEAEAMRSGGDRIGAKPRCFPLQGLATFDIDWEEDFRMGEVLWRSVCA